MNTKTIDIPATSASVRPQPLPFGGKNPSGEELAVNQRYFLRNGQPWFPVMGEIHYSRYPRAAWEESILKMQAGGVDILATYVFWLHHEEIEGEIVWEGDYDLRYFVELCARHHARMWLRIGPWCHGEARNGGFPDWLLKKDFEPRTNDDRYFAVVRRWYAAIHQQVKGLFYKDGGPIIGIQIENEYGHCGGLRGAEGVKHMLTLKRIAQDIGFDAPFYTATGWGGGVVVEGEMLPVMGGYIGMPWVQNTDPLPPSVHYLFSPDRDDQLIGADLAAQQSLLTYTPENYPFALAELGPGNQCTYHRRPVLSKQDIEAFVLAKLGSGANLIGYYMFHGGSHPIGKRSTMQESKETGYLNDLPVKSYDFQAPIREFGQISPTYRALKVLHLFLHNFGEQLAQTQVIFPADRPTDPGDVESLRYAVRDHHGAGFLFFNNYQRQLIMTEKPDCHVTIRSQEKTVEFPGFPLHSGRYGIFPYHLRVGEVTLQSATAQPLCRLSQPDAEYVVFFAYPEWSPRYIFAKDQIRTIDSPAADITEADGRMTAHVTRLGLDSLITIQPKQGKTVTVLTLTRAQAEQCWKATLWGQERLIISAADLTWTEDALAVCWQDHSKTTFAMFPQKEDLTGFLKPVRSETGGMISTTTDLFTTYTLHQPEQNIPVNVQEIVSNPLGGRQWNLTLPSEAFSGVNDIFLRIDFEGDVAQLFLDDDLIADWFYDGTIWEIGLKRFADRLTTHKLRLCISSLLQESRIYLEAQPYYMHGRVCTLKSVSAIPEYHVVIQPIERGDRIFRGGTLAADSAS